MIVDSLVGAPCSICWLGIALPSAPSAELRQVSGSATTAASTVKVKYLSGACVFQLA